MPDAPGTKAWVAPTRAMLNSYLQNALLVKLDTGDLAAGQTDRFTQAQLDVTAEVRSTIASFEFGYLLSATPQSVPPELVRTTCYLIILAMNNACPELVLDDKQRRLFERAYAWADDYASGVKKPSVPPDAEAQAVQSSPDAVVVECRPRQFTDEGLAGL